MTKNRRASARARKVAKDTGISYQAALDRDRTAALARGAFPELRETQPQAVVVLDKIVARARVMGQWAQRGMADLASTDPMIVVFTGVDALDAKEAAFTALRRAVGQAVTGQTVAFW